MSRNYDIFDFLLDLPTSQSSNTVLQRHDLIKAAEFIVNQSCYYAELISPSLEINGKIDSTGGSLTFLTKKRILFNKITFSNKVDFYLDMIKNEKSPLTFYNEIELFKIEPFLITKEGGQFVLFNDINASKSIDFLKGQVLLNFKFNIGNIDFINPDILIELFPIRFQNTLVVINIDKVIKINIQDAKIDYKIVGTFLSYSVYYPSEQENVKIIRYDGLFDLNRGKVLYSSCTEATKYLDYPYFVKPHNY